MTADHLAVDRNSTSRAYKDNFTGGNRTRLYLHYLAVAQDTGSLREKVQHVLNGAPSTSHGQPFKYFGCQDKGSNDQRGEELPNSQRGDERDGHRKLHRHAPLDDVLERLLEDGVAADQRGYQSDDADTMEGLPQVKPHCRRCRCDEQDAKYVDQFETMVVVVLFVGLAGRDCLDSRKASAHFPGLVQIGELPGFVGDGHEALLITQLK